MFKYNVWTHNSLEDTSTVNFHIVEAFLKRLVCTHFHGFFAKKNYHDKSFCLRSVHQITSLRRRWLWHYSLVIKCCSMCNDHSDVNLRSMQKIQFCQSHHHSDKLLGMFLIRPISCPCKVTETKWYLSCTYFWMVHHFQVWKRLICI